MEQRVLSRRQLDRWLVLSHTSAGGDFPARERSPWPVMLLGTALSAVSIGLVTVFIPSAWAMPTIAFVCAVGTVLILRRIWRQGPLRGGVPPAEWTNTHAKIVLQFSISIIGTLSIVAVSLFVAATSERFCVCATAKDLVSWITLAGVGALFTFLEIPALFADIVYFLRLTHREIADTSTR
jgi:hypothetical protein